jgi:hypothetical protein
LQCFIDCALFIQLIMHLQSAFSHHALLPQDYFLSCLRTSSFLASGLAPFCLSEEGWQQGAFAALGACLKNRQMYCRIRMEAAMMLGAVTSDLDGLEGEN